MQELETDWNRNSEDFKNHYVSKYDDSLLPPAWIIFETATFGLVSKFYSNIDSLYSEKAEIAKYFGFSKAAVKVLISWIHHLNTVRNICAHHARLFSKIIITRPVFPKHIKGNWVSAWQKDDRVYCSICIIKKLLNICAPDFDFYSRLNFILDNIRDDQLKIMGFPKNWKQEPLFLY